MGEFLAFPMQFQEFELLVIIQVTVHFYFTNGLDVNQIGSDITNARIF